MAQSCVCSIAWMWPGGMGAAAQLVAIPAAVAAAAVRPLVRVAVPTDPCALDVLCRFLPPCVGTRVPRGAAAALLRLTLSCTWTEAWPLGDLDRPLLLPEGVGEGGSDNSSGMRCERADSAPSESGVGGAAGAATWRYAGRRRLTACPRSESTIVARARDPTKEAAPANASRPHAAATDRPAATVQ